MAWQGSSASPTLPAMPFADCPERHRDAVGRIRRRLESDTMAHAWLLLGEDSGSLEQLATAVAMALQCEDPPGRSPGGAGADFCGRCRSCLQVAARRQADVLRVAPQSKSRVVTIDQIREVLGRVGRKSYCSPFKVAIVEGADRMSLQASNAFLKTLEEPPGETVFLLLAASAGRLPDTILSRCMAIRAGGASRRDREAPPAADAPASSRNGGDGAPPGVPYPEIQGPDSLQEREDREWLRGFVEGIPPSPGTAQRYLLLGRLLARLEERKKDIGKALGRSSPISGLPDLKPAERKRLERELDASVEAAYRRARSEILSGLHRFLRDVWIHTLRAGPGLLLLPELAEKSRQVASGLEPAAALKNLERAEDLQRCLDSSIQEALAMEAALLGFAL